MRLSDRADISEQQAFFFDMPSSKSSIAIDFCTSNTVIAVASEDWPRTLLGRVHMVAERIKPALAVRLQAEFAHLNRGTIMRPLPDGEPVWHRKGESLQSPPAHGRWF